jgi:hypothetical protein
VHAALAFIFASAIVMPAGATLLGNNFEISGPGCRFPDVAFGSVDSKYLVVWPDYNVARIFGRFVTATGAVSGAAFPISEAPFGALYPAVAYNAASNHFLVTWDDAGNRGGVIYGQRVRGSDGTLVGTNFAIGSRYGGIRSAVAWSPVSSVYLVVYWGPAPEIDIYGQWISGNGTLLGTNFNISNDAIFSGYPAVAWGASGNQFLVTWDHEDGNIHGRRVDAATGAPLGSTIFVTSGGAKDRSCIAYDSVNSRWLVQYNDGANAGFSYDQYGQLINPDGMLNAGPFPLAHTTAFEGDTQFGGDVAFVPGARRFFSSFGTDTGMGGQETFTNGAPVGAQLVLGAGYFTSLNNAADGQRNRFLTTWEGLVSGSFHVYGQLCAATINPVTNFIAASQNSQNVLSWRIPNDGHFTGTMIRVKTGGYPAGPDDGALVADRAIPPSPNDSFTHTNLLNWTTYYYAAFAHDVGPNYSLAAQAAATPRPAVVTVSASDFNAGPDGWTLETWRAGPSSFGTIAWDSASGNIVSTGSGASNNRDACTREGSTMTRAISTAGHQSIQVEYDVMASLNVAPGGSVSGNCAVLEGSIEDKLVVYYSTTGTNGPWTVAQVLNEGVELPTPWTRKLINLSGVSAVANNPNFALRFQWQFNSISDTGRVDNIRALSGAVTAPTPAIGLGATNLERFVQAGLDLPTEVFRVRNTGDGILNFTAHATASWLGVSPVSANSAGPDRTLTLAYSTATLSVGDYDAIIQVVSTNAANSPQNIAVSLHVIPPACFWEPFDFYDGNLTQMGSANWSGSATNQLQTESGVLKFVGGGGQVNATHPVNCAGSNGLIVAQIKIKKGIGTGDFFWNIAFDDPGGNNLARWYGGSTIARGRVGNNITADMLLTGVDRWDDLYLKLDAAANTSEFFFNGISFGVISHGTTPSNAVGSVRLERLDRASAANDEIRFDNLILGAPDITPPRLIATRPASALELSWPAIGTITMLESTPVLARSNRWTVVTNSSVVINSRNTVTVPATNAAAFYRLRRL